jgi:hypothetical protein
LLFRVAAPAVLIGLLGGCATSYEAHHRMHHGDSPMAHGPGAMKDSMCDMRSQMTSGETAAERQAMMDEHMKTMSPEMRKQMQAMHEQCR